MLHMTFQMYFLNENECILIQISLKFVPKGSIDNKSALIQVMAWHWTGDKPNSWSNGDQNLWLHKVS